MLFLFSSFWLQYFELKQAPFHYVRFEKETKYYEFRLLQDLLGDWIIILSNGRIKTKLGKSQTQAFSHFNDALTHLYKLIEVRFHKNYQMTTYSIENIIFLLLFSRFTAEQNQKNEQQSLPNKKIKKKLNSSFASPKKVDIQQLSLLF